ncbi:YggU family protein [candidate division WOR-1 bacterium RIFOXYB2_FULL_48_7]|uniref:UPF0235 protein A2311_02540 n=1 Tax=candidate division WOR-1 bacterium RIFOXYB2_FULL_48_7 TaxID=1802583 RepID=A0A1F4TIK0_UNCSA|nr:MAG: YggU family protein [candidate division WOR-1 bacterium RIFOXYB2_FULL_48_7]
MKIEIKVIPNAKRNKIVPLDGSQGYKVYLTAPAVDGKANQALIAFLAEHFQTKKSAVSILRGEKSRQKLIYVKIA